ILVYVEGRNGRLGNHHDDDEGADEEDAPEGRRLRRSPGAVKIGQQASFQGNLYVPNGTLHLRQGSTAVGSFIARDIIVGVRTQVVAQSGWHTPGVVYQPQGPAPLAKLASGQSAETVLPTGTGLLANYPNPFNPSTTVPYVLAEAGQVRLSVYNVLGQQIRVLVDQLQIPGAYTVSWDGMDAAGLQAAGGVYFYRLEAGDQVQVRKMLFAK
ncbi:MAG: T9SS type A sorting domain-containing protein, partial [Candidatus Latescibacteria bacterium]|nr:T9SS type A sorting domain-containing protein [Candidatus Latescibacterota bacterium]